MDLSESDLMKNILLNDGKLIPILSKDDALEVIKENLSSDLAIYLNHIIADMELDEQEMEQLEKDNMRLESENEELKSENTDLERKVTKLENGIESLLSKLENNNTYNKEETEEVLRI